MTDRLVAVEFADGASSPAAERERQVAVRDLLEENRFALPLRDGRAVRGPYRLRLAVRDRRLVFAVQGEAGLAAEFHLSLEPFRQVVKDYVQILQSHEDAVSAASRARVEPLLQNARTLVVDAAARRLFTLVCALHPDGPSAGGPGAGGQGA